MVKINGKWKKRADLAVPDWIRQKMGMLQHDYSCWAWGESNDRCGVEKPANEEGLKFKLYGEGTAYCGGVVSVGGVSIGGGAIMFMDICGGALWVLLAIELSCNETWCGAFCLGGGVGTYTSWGVGACMGLLCMAGTLRSPMWISAWISDHMYCG